MNRIINRITITVLCVCFAALALIGCSQQSESTSQVTIEEPTFDLVIGSEDTAVVALPMTNGTDLPISAVQFKTTNDGEYSPNMMESDQVWEPSQVANIFFEGVLLEESTQTSNDSSSSTSDESSSDTSSSSDDAIDDDLTDDLLLNETYDIEFTLSDGTMFTLHQLDLVNLCDAENITIHFDTAQAIGYLTYMENGSEVNTLEAEMAIVDAEIQAQAEAKAAEEAQLAAQKASSSTSKKYDSVSSGGSSGSKSNSPSQSVDTCDDPDDVILN